jgi:ABC-type uncharacterized transport system permease subunit
MRHISRLAVSLALASSLAGCSLALRSPHIAELQQNPARFYNKTVNVDGVVTSSWGVPLVPFHLYKVSDGTGEVTVVSNSGYVPAKGAHVRVKGKVNDFATLGGRPLGLHIEQESLKVKGGYGY